MRTDFEAHMVRFSKTTERKMVTNKQIMMFSTIRRMKGRIV